MRGIYKFLHLPLRLTFSVYKYVVVNFFISGNFYFSFVSTSLAYITIPKNITEKYKLPEIKN